MNERRYAAVSVTRAAAQNLPAPALSYPHNLRRRLWMYLRASTRLVRLSNSLPASTLVLLGGYLITGWPLGQRVWIAALAMWCITGFGYASNDYFDQAEDAVNKPDRPLPAGRLADWFAAALSGLLALAALGLSAGLGWRELAVALAVLLLLTLYNLRLKATPGGGNLLVATLAGATLVTGAVASRGFSWVAVAPVLLPATLLTLFIAAREVLKTMEDVAGDQAAGKRTVAVQLGLRATVWLLAGLAVLTGLASVLPVLFQRFSWLYLLLVQVGVVAPLLFTVVHLWREVTVGRVRRCLRLLKASYFVGLAALLLA
jgi:geranylgeranylglycerol-phosphate geranylgeranyltransferase